MIDGFGYERYGAHGSDLGADVTGWLARDHPDSLTGIHLAAPGLAVPADRRSAGEERFAEAVGRWAVEEGSYMHEHATNPATLAAALTDSPVGLAAWIGEKVVAWSSERATSLLPYWSYQHGDGALPAGNPSPVPTSVTVFGGESGAPGHDLRRQAGQ
jgi:pimeloyl-ACP methyl ester carboxylesterase